MSMANLQSDEESEEYNSSSSSIEIKQTSSQRIPHIPLKVDQNDQSKGRRAHAISVKETGQNQSALTDPPLLDNLDLRSDKSLGYDAVLRKNENNQFKAFNASDISGNFSNIENGDLHPAQNEGIDTPQESEEFSSSRSSIEIVPKTGIPPLPRVATVSSDTPNILDKLKSLLESEHLEQKPNLKTLPNQNIDSPQESEELNSSISSIDVKQKYSISVAPRPAQANSVTKIPDPVLKLQDTFLESERTEQNNLENESPGESEEFKSSTSSINFSPIIGKNSLKPRKNEEELKDASKMKSKDDQAPLSSKLPRRPNDDPKSPENIPSSATEVKNLPQKIAISDESQKSNVQSSAYKEESKSLSWDLQSKDEKKGRQIRPRNSAAIDPLVRFGARIESSSSSSVESDSDDEAEIVKKIATNNENNVKMEYKSKYYRWYVQKTVPQPRYSSVIDNIAYYFALYDQKCYFSGFLFKRNELGVDGKVLDKKDTLRQHGTIERGGEWVKYWAEIVGGEFQLWKVPMDLQPHIYPNDPKKDIIRNSKQTNAKGIDDLIQTELFPSLEYIETIKRKSTPFILNLTNSTTRLNDASLNATNSDTDNIPLPPIPFTSLFSLSNHGQNKFSFASPSIVTSNLWTKAIQLSVFENDQISFVFSMKSLKEVRYMNVWTDLCIHPFSCGLKNKTAPFEGSIGAKHAIDNQVTNYFCIITQVDGELSRNKKEQTRKSHMFGRSKTDNGTDDLKDAEEVEDDQKGQLMLYQDESEHKRGHRPLVKIEDIYSAFLVWPKAENPVDNDLVTTIKVYGKITYELPFESKKKNRKSRLTWLETEKPLPAENHKEMLMDAISRSGESFLIFSFKDTQESLRFLVSVWNAFGIETQMVRCNEKEYIWQDPPPLWGNLSLNLDELVGDLILTDLRNSFDSFNLMVNDKFLALKHGLLQEWRDRVNAIIDFHDSIEVEELRLKAYALVDSAHTLPKDTVLPVWLKAEFAQRNITLDDGKIKSTSHDDQDAILQNETTSLKENYNLNGDMILVKVQSDIKSDHPKPPPRGVTLGTSSRNSASFPNAEKRGLDHEKRASSNNTGPMLSFTKLDSSPEISSSSEEESAVPANVENTCLDLTRTIPKDLNLNIQDLIASWTAEEVSRFQNHVAWISKESDNQDQQDQMGISQAGNTDNFIFDSNSLLGTGFQPRRKKEIIHGPLVSSIPENEDGRKRAGNRASRIMLTNSTNEEIIGQSFEETIFVEGLLGQKKTHAIHAPGSGPLISAIPISKEEIKPVHTLDQGLLGQMQSREEYIKYKTSLKALHSPRQSYINRATINPNQNYYGHQNHFLNGQNYSNPQYKGEMHNLQQGYNYAFSPNATQDGNTTYGNQLGYLPIEYQQAFMYQQYMYASEAQSKSKEKKKSKKKIKKKKDKKKKGPIAPLTPQMVPYYIQSYTPSTYTDTVNPSEPIARPVTESSSEESDESA